MLRLFVEKGGVELLLTLYRLPRLPPTFGSTNASHRCAAGAGQPCTACDNQPNRPSQPCTCMHMLEGAHKDIFACAKHVHAP